MLRLQIIDVLNAARTGRTIHIVRDLRPRIGELQNAVLPAPLQARLQRVIERVAIVLEVRDVQILRERPQRLQIAWSPQVCGKLILRNHDRKFHTARGHIVRFGQPVTAELALKSKLPGLVVRRPRTKLQLCNVARGSRETCGDVRVTVGIHVKLRSRHTVLQIVGRILAPINAGRAEGLRILRSRTITVIADGGKR